MTSTQTLSPHPELMGNAWPEQFTGDSGYLIGPGGNDRRSVAEILREMKMVNNTTSWAETTSALGGSPVELGLVGVARRTKRTRLSDTAAAIETIETPTAANAGALAALINWKELATAIDTGPLDPSRHP